MLPYSEQVTKLHEQKAAVEKEEGRLSSLIFNPIFRIFGLEKYHYEDSYIVDDKLHITAEKYTCDGSETETITLPLSLLDQDNPLFAIKDYADKQKEKAAQAKFSAQVAANEKERARALAFLRDYSPGDLSPSAKGMG